MVKINDYSMIVINYLIEIHILAYVKNFFCIVIFQVAHHFGDIMLKKSEKRINLEKNAKTVR